jgi:hypothetical protein
MGAGSNRFDLIQISQNYSFVIPIKRQKTITPALFYKKGPGADTFALFTAQRLRKKYGTLAGLSIRFQKLF